MTTEQARYVPITYEGFFVKEIKVKAQFDKLSIYYTYKDNGTQDTCSFDPIFMAKPMRESIKAVRIYNKNEMLNIEYELHGKTNPTDAMTGVAIPHSKINGVEWVRIG